MTIAEENELKAQQILAAKAKLGLDLERLQRLLANEDFQWWMTEHVMPMVKHEHDQALTVKNGKEAMFIYACRHDALAEVAESVKELAAEKLKNLQAMVK